MEVISNSTEERIKSIHKSSIVVDAHFDLLIGVVAQRQYGHKKVIETDHLPNFIKGGVNLVVLSIFIDSMFLPEMSLRKALDQISALYAEIDESPDKIMICKNYNDIVKAQNEGKVGFILSFEGVEPLYNDLSLLSIFYKLGVRLVGLTWSRRNFAGDGSYYFSKVREGKKGGITDFGVELIEKAESLSMLIDVSHLNDEGFWDVIKIAKKPVIASHSNCRAIVNSLRNLTDEQIRAIADKGGVIGINGFNIFTADKDKDGDIEHLINHVDHIVELIGVRHVGLGFDFYDDFRKFFSSSQNMEALSRKRFDVLKGHKSIEQFTKGLIVRGYTDEEIKLILGENFLKIYREVLK